MKMGGDERVPEWAARQRANALHVGTYESAVHNMLKRMHDQADQHSQFYLYRVPAGLLGRECSEPLLVSLAAQVEAEMR